MKKIVVLYPGLAVSHFIPMMQLADVLLEEGYDIVVALIDITMEHNIALAAAVDRVIASSKPAVTFHTLPRIHDPPTVTNDVNLLLGYLEIIRRYNEHLREFLCSIPPPSIHAVIVDSWSDAALDVTGHLGIPAYSFFASNASALAVCLQLPYWARRRAEGQPSFKELAGDATVNFHGVPPIPASHLIREVLEDPNTEIYRAVMNSLGKNLEAAGILVNTFASLEPRAVAALKDPHFLTTESGLTVPPVYCVGPLVEEAAAETKQKHECLTWLDEQPERSVVFLCFGSLGNHSETQLKEIAAGLERSGHRFLWVVRAPLGDNPEKTFGDQANPDLHTLLPEGFLERTRGRGLVVKLWAPQVEVLRHKATGAFVTHCGWNSVLEAIMAGGVPMLCWPLYAEQKMNKVLMVEEIGIGVELAGWQHGLVKADELEAKVRLVMMESEEGEQLRARVTAHKEAAGMAWKDGGSSRMAFGQFLSDAAKVGQDRLTLG